MKRTGSLLVVLILMLSVVSGCGREPEIHFFEETGEGDVYAGNGAQNLAGQNTEQDGQGAEGSGAVQTGTPGTAREEEVTAAEQICVHVCGQVCRPGVVMLPGGSRAWEAVEAAGGLTEEAQEEAVNLAALLQDGEKLYIPAVGESVPETEEERPDSGLVNLNTADAERLQSLPGIGESRAADIISYRERNGGFESVEEIMQVPGIKESTYEKIRDKISVD